MAYFGEQEYHNEGPDRRYACESTFFFHTPFFVVSILNNKHVIFNKIIPTFFGCNKNVKVLNFHACIMDCKVIKHTQHGGFHECCNKATRRNENEIRNWKKTISGRWDSSAGKEQATKPDDLNGIPRTHDARRPVLWAPPHPLQHTWTYILTHQ